MSGAGNMFLVFKSNNAIDTDSVVRKLINKYKAQLTLEGLMAISDSKDSDFDVKFYNPDGSTGMMCGNGGRCAVYFAKHVKFISEDQIETNFSMSGNKYFADFAEKGIKLYFDFPKKIQSNKILKLDSNKYQYDFYDVGTTHVCIDISTTAYDEEIDSIDIDSFAIPIRNHEEFFPVGVNVNLYKVVSPSKIYLRTFEKGVEAQTGACGTGAISTALSAASRYDIAFPIEILPPSKESLWIDKTENNIILEGPVRIIKELELEI